MPYIRRTEEAEAGGLLPDGHDAAAAGAEMSPSGGSSRRFARVLLGLALLVWAAVLGLYGLFAIVYEPDGGGDAYIGISGRDLDADLVGGIALALAVAALLAGLLLLRRARAG